MRGFSSCKQWWFLFFGGITLQIAGAGSPVYVGTRKHSNQSMDTVDHTEWKRLLLKFVDEDGRVD
ncbi:MAG: hypothetical protein VYA84_14815 [Planctomycetota bacterium]|nr:hypothetical protein [Planctomycetota bacterium]